MKNILQWKETNPPRRKRYKMFNNMILEKSSKTQRRRQHQHFKVLMFHWLSIFVGGACRSIEKYHSKGNEKSDDESSAEKMSPVKKSNSSTEAEKGKNSLKIFCHSFHSVCSISVISEKKIVPITLFENFENPEKELCVSFFLPVLPLKNVTHWCSGKLLRKFYLAD